MDPHSKSGFSIAQPFNFTSFAPVTAFHQQQLNHLLNKIDARNQFGKQGVQPQAYSFPESKVYRHQR